MMPQLLTVRIRRDHGRRMRLWIPILPLLILLSPVLLLASVVLAIVCLTQQINPIRALGSGGRLVLALTGTRIEVEHGPTLVLIAIS